jgi:hypothetical protein
MVKRLIEQLVDPFGSWNSSFKPSTWGHGGDEAKTLASTRVAMASAVLWVLSHPSDYDNGADGAYNLLQDKAVGQKVWSINGYMSTWRYWVGDPAVPQTLAKINVLFKTGAPKIGRAWRTRSLLNRPGFFGDLVA